MPGGITRRAARAASGLALLLLAVCPAGAATMGQAWTAVPEQVSIPKLQGSIREFKGRLWAPVNETSVPFAFQFASTEDFYTWEVYPNQISPLMVFAFDDLLVRFSPTFPPNQFEISPDGINWSVGRQESDRPLPTSEAIAIFQNRIYRIGGGEFDAHSDRHEVWSFGLEDGWRLETDNAPWGHERKGAFTASLGDTMYYMGGTSSKDFPRVAFADVYRTLDGTNWEKLVDVAPWPARVNAACSTFQNSIWLFGGSPDGIEVLNDLWKSSDGISWERIEHGDYPPARKNARMFEFDGKLWIANGSDISVSYNDVWYSHDGVTWELFPSVRPWYFRSMMAAVAFQDALWVIGGIDATGMHDDVWRSEDGQNWEGISAHAGWSARRDHKVVTHDGALWLVGGTDGTREFNDVWRSDDGATWTQLTADAPFATRYAHSLASHDGKLWVLGGKHANSGLSDVWNSVDGVNWTPITDAAPWRLSGAACTEHNGRIYLVGGTSYFDGGIVDSVWSSHDGAKWVNEGSGGRFPTYWPPPRENAGLVSYAGRLWLTNGFSGYFESLEGFVYLDDFWTSLDGKAWRKLNGSSYRVPGLPWEEEENQGSAASFPSPIAARQGHGFVALDNKLWILGGEQISVGRRRFDDVWYAELDPLPHSADLNNDALIDLDELLRCIQFYNSLGFSCAQNTEDNFVPGLGTTECEPHSTDYAPQDWSISLDELLRAIQFYNTPEGYHPCPEGEDGFCLGAAA